MTKKKEFHIVTVGWGYELLNCFSYPIEAKSSCRFSHIVHPGCTPEEWPDENIQSGVYFFMDGRTRSMPLHNPELLNSLEQEEVPTIHNMIMSDRIVSKLKYEDVLGYATFLTERLYQLFEEIKPSVVIGGFDGIHAGIALGVAKDLNIPWYALNYSVVPPGLACLSKNMTPAGHVTLKTKSTAELKSFAETSLRQFEQMEIAAPAHIARRRKPIKEQIIVFPKRLGSLYRIFKKSRQRNYIQFTEERENYNIIAALKLLFRQTRAQKSISRIGTSYTAESRPYVLFGLHMQPESTIDVWAPFYSNQLWVIELLSRSIPNTHKLLVKIHKSDISNYSQQRLDEMRGFPGVELVSPFADTRSLLQNADLIISIQGTMGLEAGLLGKPVIMFGDSPFTKLPSVSSIGAITDLPALIRRKLKEPVLSRVDIVDAYAAYLAPFFPASRNDWSVKLTEEEINGYVHLFSALEHYIG